MAIIIIFVDGIGLGKEHPENPFRDLQKGAFRSMTGGQPFMESVEPIERENFVFKPIDARLGVEGLPQSGTGQATLFSGVNAAKVLDRHFGPFPHSKIRYLLTKESLFQKAQERGYRCYFMNAYPDIFFEQAREKQRWTCTTLMARSAGVSLNTERDLRAGRAITAEIVNRSWKEKLNIDLPEIGPGEAADRLLRIAREKEVILFEYFLTDKAGHAQDMEWAGQILDVLDGFLTRLMNRLSPRDSIVLSSDHGNMEDLSRKTHTLNPVPLFVQGPAAQFFREARSITDVTSGILSALE